MAESDDIQETVNQAAVQEVTAVTMVLWDTNVGSQLAPTASVKEPQRQRHGGLTLEKP